MPPPRRIPRPPGKPEPPPPPPAKKRTALFIAAGAALLVVVAAIFLFTGKEAPPPPPKKPPKVTPRFFLQIYHEDLGRSRHVVLLVNSNVPVKPEDFTLIDGEGAQHPAGRAQAAEYFLLEARKNPDALALSFRPPGKTESLDLRVPGGEKLAVYRKPGRELFRAMNFPMRHEDWTVTGSGTPSAAAPFEIEIRAAPAAENPQPVDPKRFLILTDEGDTLSPEVLSDNPFRLRYPAVPKSAKELRLQTSFRGERPAYWALSCTPPAVEAAPAAPKAPEVKPPPPAVTLRQTFEKLLSDPFAALKHLADQPPSDEVRQLAREAIARWIVDDAAAGLKAASEKKADLAERHLTRAALLAAPYNADFSRQLMRILFLMKQPRRAPTDCKTCKGAGSAPCTECKEGLTLGKCPRCTATGLVACILCEGSGTTEHHGYKGTMIITISNPFKDKDEFGRSGTYPAQTITYHMSPCAGAGAFPLRTESVAKKTGARKEDSLQQPCTKFWNDLRRNVFTGKANIQIPGPKGQMIPYSASAGRRFFADYELCRNGRVPCDRCSGKKNTTCSLCSGKGQAMVICPSCDGTTLRACASCKGYGDASWVARILPSAPTLSETLTGHTAALRAWMDENGRRDSRRDEFRRRLEEAKKGLDPTAKVGADFVNVTCPQCKGAGGNCGECWATGRREYFEGTPQYERYALVTRLERQFEEAGKAAAAPPPALGALPLFDSASASAGRPSNAPVIVYTAPAIPIPKDIDEIILKADALFVTGRDHLERAKLSQDNNVWIEESVKALQDLRNAQTFYATAQEKLDAKGAAVPDELLRKFRTTMQALVIARKQAP